MTASSAPLLRRWPLDAEVACTPMPEFLEVWRVTGCELVALEADRLTIGRDDASDVTLKDQTVSRLHAVLERYGKSWVLRDMGSANGTLLNGERIGADRPLHGGDEVGIGSIRLVYRRGGKPSVEGQTLGAEKPPQLTRRERDLLIALCRPLRSGEPFAEPASVAELAEALVVSEAAVKFHLGNLYDKFGIYEGPGSRRARLAREALRRRAVAPAELD